MSQPQPKPSTAPIPKSVPALPAVSTIHQYSVQPTSTLDNRDASRPVHTERESNIVVSTAMVAEAVDLSAHPTNETQQPAPSAQAHSTIPLPGLHQEPPSLMNHNYQGESHSRPYDLPRDPDGTPHRTPSMPTTVTAGMSLPPSNPDLMRGAGTRLHAEAFAMIAPRKPGSAMTSQGNTASMQKPPRAKRRRLIGAGKHWASAVDKFVHDIPAVPYFSDPRRNAPQRDMRGWITQIAKPAHKLVWDRLMTALSQEDLNENGDEDICRHILGSVVHEKQDPASEKKQTRQAVNNAIKRELSLPRASGQTGRGETFRELFREKAMGAGFRLTPVEKHEKDEPIEDNPMPGAMGSGGPAHGVLGTGLVYRNGDQSIPGTRGSHSLGTNSSLSSDPLDTYGFGNILEPNEASRWINIVHGCDKTPAGDLAWWSSTEMRVHDMKQLALYLVRTGNVAELKRLLIDFRWLRKFTSASSHGIMSLVKKGYDVLLAVKTDALSLVEREGYRLIRNALMLVTPILRPQLVFGQILGTQDIAFCAHLGTQLYGRLLSASCRFSVVSSLLESIRVHIVAPWLRPLNPCFDSPKSDIALAVKSGPGALASAVAISGDGELLVTTGTEMRGVKQNVRVWEVSTGNCLSTIPVNSVLLLAISPDKKYVVSVSMGNDGPLMFWAIVDEKKRFIENVKDESVVRAANFTKETIFSIMITPDSKSVISASESLIVKWNIETGAEEGRFKGVSGTIYSIDLSPDGELLLAGAQQGLIGLWSVHDFERLLLIKNEGEHHNFPKPITSGNDFSGNKISDDVEQIKGKRVYSVSFMMRRTPVQSSEEPFKIVAGSDSNFRVWRLPGLAELRTDNFDFHFSYSAEIGGLGVINNMRATDEETIFFASGDGMVRLWKLLGEKTDKFVELGTDAPKMLAAQPHNWNNRQPEHTMAIFLRVSDDGQKVAASTDRPFVLVWDVGQYEETLREQKHLRAKPYFPGIAESLSHVDMYTQPHGLIPEFNKFFSNSSDAKRELRILRKKENDNDLKLVFHPNMEERSVVFDQDIDLDQCRVGVFIKEPSQAIAPREMDHRPPDEDCAERREGLGVRFRDKNIAFFEAERGTPKAARTPYSNA